MDPSILTEKKMTTQSVKKYLLGVVLFLLPCACATLPPHPTPADNPKAFTLKDDGTRLTHHAPIFIIENFKESHNRIGTPTARRDNDGGEQVFINPDRATLYAEERPFTTAKGHYTNLIYRLHFQKIPGGFRPYYLGKGKNVGLIVVVTLDGEGRPLLYTTVHTCGCYLAFVPTSFLPETSFPQGWKRERQEVHAENLPGFLEISPPFSRATPPMILIRDATHRVKNLWIRDTDESISIASELEGYPQGPAEIRPLTALKALPFDGGGTTSFYETSGSRRGYVKGSQKSRERMWMSWWAMDWRIGEDKILGASLEEGPSFYTSLKPWAKKASDMRDFTQFLDHWGWHL